MNNKLEVIGIDHGWSMMKTISQVFVTGAVSGTDGNEQTDGLKMGIWCLSYNRTKLDETQ